MIVGAHRWNDRNSYYIQTNDALEETLRKLGYAQPLQSCGPNAACSCMEAVGHDLSTKTRGGWYVPPDDLLTAWLNNPRNYVHLAERDPRAEPNNRHAVFYPAAVRNLWGVRAEWLPGFRRQEMGWHLAAHRALQVCINPPGHYLAVVALDEATGEYIANDPWPGRKRVPSMNGDGFNIRLTQTEVDSIVAEAVVYYPEG